MALRTRASSNGFTVTLPRNTEVSAVGRSYIRTCGMSLSASSWTTSAVCSPCTRFEANASIPVAGSSPRSVAPVVFARLEHRLLADFVLYQFERAEAIGAGPEGAALRLPQRLERLLTVFGLRRVVTVLLQRLQQLQSVQRIIVNDQNLSLAVAHDAYPPALAAVACAHRFER